MNNPADAQRLMQDAARAEDAGELERSATLYAAAAQADPGDPRAPHNLGLLLLRMDRVDQACAYLAQAVQRGPEMERTWASLGHGLARKGQRDKAVQCYRQAVTLNPAFAEGWVNLGQILVEMNAPDEAEDAYQAALRVAPRTGMALKGLGDLSREKGRIVEAAEFYRRALQELSPTSPVATHARWMLGLSLLTLGDFEEGWDEYESRLKSTMSWHHDNWCRIMPPWDGSLTPGLRLAVHYEQGLGDTLQFVRYVPLLLERGLQVSLVVQTPLVGFLRRQHPALAEVIVDGSSGAPEADAHVSLMSLPHHLVSITGNAIPARTAYLSADPALARDFSARIRPIAAGRPAIGVVWAGNPLHALDARRSIPFSTFRALFDLDQVAFFSVQVGEPAAAVREPGHPNLHDLSLELTDFDRSAAVFSALDGIVSVDTGPAHLAGALGRPTAILLADYSDWRWGRGHLTRTPWYPTARLYRQDHRDDWPRVIDALRARMAAGQAFA